MNELFLNAEIHRLHCFILSVSERLYLAAEVLSIVAERRKKMSRGENLATCHHCGKRWRVGDCIPTCCDECQEDGHNGLSLDCPKCFQPDQSVTRIIRLLLAEVELHNQESKHVTPQAVIDAVQEFLDRSASTT